MNTPDLRIVSFNVRGLNNPQKRIAIFNLIKKKKCDVIFFQETYSSIADEYKWSQQWGGQVCYSHGTKHSKGTAILFRKGLDVNILSKRVDDNGRFIILKCCISDYFINLINVYVPNKENMKQQFINDLEK